MKILFINPPQIFSKTQGAAGVLPPLGLLYLAAYLREKGQEVKVCDAIVEKIEQITQLENGSSIRGLNFEEIIERIDEGTAIIGISNLFSFAFPVVSDLCKKIKEAYPNIKIVLGGAHPSAVPELCLKDSKADFIIISEGELSMNKLVNCLKDNKDFKDVDGLAYRKGNKIIVNPKKEFIQNLDNLPFPARDLVDMEKYYSVHEAHGPSQEKWTPILSSRGCPFKCTFCTSKLWNRLFRARSVENVLKEMEHCINEYGIKEFHFEDENMTLNNVRVREICKGIIKNKWNIKWQTPNGIRASVTDNETLDLMKESGCYHITVAPESGSHRVLNEIIHKQQDLEKVSSIIDHAVKLKLRTAAYFVLGLPGETIEDVEMTIDYATSLAKKGLDEVAFSNFIPLPGSELYTKLEKEGKLDYDWLSYTSIGDLSKSISWSEEISNKQLQKLRQKAYLKFHFTKLIYHPLKVLRSILNVLRNKEELKTERVLITFIKRFFNR